MAYGSMSASRLQRSASRPSCAGRWIVDFPSVPRAFAFQLAEIRAHQVVAGRDEMAGAEDAVDLATADLDLVAGVQEARIARRDGQGAHGEEQRREAEQPNAVGRARQGAAVVEGVLQMAAGLGDEGIHHRACGCGTGRIEQRRRIDAGALAELARDEAPVIRLRYWQDFGGVEG